MKQPCVFFDRDGIVNQSPGPGYVERVADFHLLPAFVAALRTVSERGYPAVVVTNQRGVGRGLMTEETLLAIHERLQQELAQTGLALRDVVYCTADDNADPRRKPNPGMLLEAAERHGLDLDRSWMVGASETDVQAGRRAGCRTVLVGPGPGATEADHRLASMEDLAPFFERVL
jgi:D-glycero-D-manno-heptose 1,7-bisphosphate phosphatase